MRQKRPTRTGWRRSSTWLVSCSWRAESRRQKRLSLPTLNAIPWDRGPTPRARLPRRRECTDWPRASGPQRFPRARLDEAGPEVGVLGLGILQHQQLRLSQGLRAALAIAKTAIEADHQ